MTDNMNTETLTPTLSLDIDDVPAVKELEPKDAEAFRLQKFSPEEMKQINDFSQKIDLHDSDLIIKYGAGAQKRLADFSDSVLESVRAKDMDEVGDMISQLVADLKYDPEEKKGFKGLFAKKANKIEQMKAHYTKVEGNIESITRNLEKHQETLLKDISIQDRLFDNNKAFFKEITMYIEAGKIALKRAREQELPALQAKSSRIGTARRRSGGQGLFLYV